MIVDARKDYPEFYSNISFKIEKQIFSSLFSSLTNRNVELTFFSIMGIRHFYTQEFCMALGMSDEDTMFCVLKYGQDLPK